MHICDIVIIKKMSFKLIYSCLINAWLEKYVQYIFYKIKSYRIFKSIYTVFFVQRVYITIQNNENYKKCVDEMQFKG